ncbi:MAG: hypothetical protein ACI8RZ_003165 [Myxococcota bacterium]|jgi:hypothetical protein
MLLGMLLSVMLFGCSAGSDTASLMPDTEDPGIIIDPEESPYFEPVALSVSYTGGWDEHQDALLDWAYEGEGYDGYIRLTLVTEQFFSLSTDDQLIDEEYCEIRALFHSDPATLTAERQDDGTPAALRAAFTGHLEIYGFIGSGCYNFDPAVWTNGEPREVFNGMRLGLGFGEMTDFLSASWDSETLQAYSSHMMAAYVAINHPDGTGGVEFIARDWTTAVLWQWDVESGEVLTNSESNLMGQDITDPVLSGWVSGYPFWYQPLNELDLGLLKNGVEEAAAE